MTPKGSPGPGDLGSFTINTVKIPLPRKGGLKAATPSNYLSKLEKQKF